MIDFYDANGDGFDAVNNFMLGRADSKRRRTRPVPQVPHMNKIVRKAAHAGPGKLYHSNPKILNAQLNKFLANADTQYMP